MTSPSRSIYAYSPINVECVLSAGDHPDREEVLLSITNTVKEALALLGASSVSFVIKESSGPDPLKSYMPQLHISAILLPEWRWEKSESHRADRKRSANHDGGSDEGL